MQLFPMPVTKTYFFHIDVLFYVFLKNLILEEIKMSLGSMVEFILYSFRYQQDMWLTFILSSFRYHQDMVDFFPV